jgi:Anti-sigma-K factor rskA
LVWKVGATGAWQAKGQVGSVIWNPRLQRAYLRIAGVDPNDPVREQYQAWLFDAGREKYAVSGGVFDLSASTPRDDAGNYIVPIRPDLPVGSLTQFAVTIERPGGVVVTDGKRLVLSAKGEGP